MKTDEELIERLRRASRTVVPPMDPLERLHRRRTTKRHRERLAAGILALALFGAAVGGSLYALRDMWNGAQRTLGSNQGGSGAPGSAPSTPGLGLQPGQYFYLSTHILLAPEGKVRIQTWWATDGSGRIEAVEYEDAHYGLPPEGTFGPGEFPIESDVSDLPTDPSKLYEELLRRSAPDGASPQPEVSPAGPGQTQETGPMWRAVKRLLEYPNALPELREALIEVAQRIPGVEVRHGVDGFAGAGDSVGRPADAVELTTEGATETIAYDPATLQPYEIASIPIDDPENGWYEIFEEGIVDSMEDPPKGDQWVMPNPV